MQLNLYEFMRSRRGVPLDPRDIRDILYHVLIGLDHIHRHQYIHRDIKPENILLTQSGYTNGYRFIVKIADFGSSRCITDKNQCTFYVATRWYRAPEIIFRCSYYGFSVDIWALGAIAAELATFHPIFPGISELDQITKYVEILGTPSVHSLGGYWPVFFDAAERFGFHYEPVSP